MYVGGRAFHNDSFVVNLETTSSRPPQKQHGNYFGRLCKLVRNQVVTTYGRVIPFLCPCQIIETGSESSLGLAAYGSLRLLK